MGNPSPDDHGITHVGRLTIKEIIPPREGSRVGTLVFDPKDNPPVESLTVRSEWLRNTHARVGARVSFEGDGWLRYHWEELPRDLQKVGIMDELHPRTHPNNSNGKSQAKDWYEAMAGGMTATEIARRDATYPSAVLQRVNRYATKHELPNPVVDVG